MELVRRWWWVGAIAAVILLLVARWQLGAPAVEAGFATAETGAVEQLVANSEAGTVRSRRVSHVSADRAGRLVDIGHREGARVAAGTVLAQLDTSTARAALEVALRQGDAAAAQQQAAEAGAQLAREQFARAEALHRRAMISDDELQQARSRRDAAEGTARAAAASATAARAQVAAQRDELAHLRVRAPFAGVLSRLHVEVGESVVPGQVLCELISLDHLYVTAPIDERDAGTLRAGLPARVTLDAYPDVVWSAPVARVAPYAEEMKQQNRTVAVEVDLPADTTRPQPAPGMTADVELVLSRRDGVLRVPASAVMDNRRVLVVRGDRASERGVRVGLRNWDWAQIDSGLVAGERVITTLGRPGVVAGARVKAEGAKGQP